MSVVTPRRDHWLAFTALAKGELGAWAAIQSIAAEDRFFRAEFPVGADDSIWYRSDGRPYMRKTFGRRRLLRLSAELDRLGLGLSLSNLLDHVEVEGDVAEDGRAISTQLRSPEESGDDVWQYVLRIRGASEVLSESVEAAEESLGAFLGGSAESDGPESNRTSNRPDSNDEESDSIVDDPFTEAALEAIYAADDAGMLILGFCKIREAERDAQLDEIEERFDESVRRRWLDIPGHLLTESQQLSDGIDNLLATRLLAPSLLVPVSQTRSTPAWQAYPWFSARARGGFRRLGVEEAGRQPLMDFLRSDEQGSIAAAEATFALLDQIMSVWIRDPGKLEPVLAKGFGWELAGGLVNLIPSPHRGPCCRILVTVSVGTELDLRLRQTHDHCIRCGQTQRILFVTDYWDESFFLNGPASTFEALRNASGCRLAVLVKSGSVFKFWTVGAGNIVDDRGEDEVARGRGIDDPTLQIQHRVTEFLQKAAPRDVSRFNALWPVIAAAPSQSWQTSQFATTSGLGFSDPQSTRILAVVRLFAKLDSRPRPDVSQVTEETLSELRFELAEEAIAEGLPEGYAHRYAAFAARLVAPAEGDRSSM